MYGYLKIFPVILVAVIALSSCGEQKQAGSDTHPASFLAERVDSLSLQRSSDVRVFVGDSLWEYINGGAELYHLYGFVEVATADYNVNGAEIVVDVYQFDNADNAFGLYSQLRPSEPQGVSLGVDGFSSETNLIFVKGQYMGVITGFQASEEMAGAIESAGRWLETVLPGTTAMPTTFELLPTENGIPASEQIIAESFLGHSFLTQIYSRRYALGADTLTLFVASDGPSKITAWQAKLGEPSDHFDLSSLPFESQALATENDYYGTIVAGTIGDRLVGVVGYSDSHRDFVAGWLGSLSTAPK